MSDVIVEAHGPESIFQAAKFVRTVVSRQRERPDRLRVNEGEDCPEALAEHRLPPHQAVNIVGVTQFSQSRRPRRIFTSLAFHFHDEVIRESRIEQKSGFLTRSSPKSPAWPRRSPHREPVSNEYTIRTPLRSGLSVGHSDADPTISPRFLEKVNRRRRSDDLVGWSCPCSRSGRTSQVTVRAAIIKLAVLDGGRLATIYRG